MWNGLAHQAQKEDVLGKVNKYPKPETPLSQSGLKELLSAIKSHLATLTDEERIDFMNDCIEGYCDLCGSKYLPCYCHPGYDI